jgi:hypothetical protein
VNNEPEVIRARFVEAAHTERFLPNAKMPTASGYWPEFFYDDKDKEGWDDAARLDNAEKWKGRASSGAISRHQECMEWTTTIIGDGKRRQIVWAWAFCRANGWDFGARCVKRGWARPTAYRRLSAAMEAISVKFAMEGSVVRLPDEKYLRQEQPVMACVSGTMGQRDNQAAAIKFTPGYQTEKSRDLLQTEEDAETFAKFLERRNARLRKLNAWRNEQVA